MHGRDQVLDLAELPQASVGAPQPFVCASEGRLLLVYDLERLPSGGPVAHMVDPGSQPTPAALIDFHGVRAITWGLPNDEALSGHPLARHGLRWYAAQEVRHSSWISELEHRNRVHPRHNTAAFQRLRHFIFTFHDSTLECLAEEFSASIFPSGRTEALAECQRRAESGEPAA
ncbi:MAG: hypothetical protein ACREOC_18445 [Gemmatimonadales bacterium]